VLSGFVAKLSDIKLALSATDGTEETALNFRLLKIALLVVLLVGLYFFFQGGALVVTDKPSEPSTSKTEVPAISPANQKSETPAAQAPTSGTIALSEEARNNQAVPQANPEFSCSLKKEDNERKIAPGVAVIPGQGISIKTDAKDETVMLQRDHTYNGDYQVLWKKKY
jgi:hypothetical protein